MVRLEGRLRAVLFRLIAAFDFTGRDSALIFLIEGVSVATNFDVAPFGEEIHDRNADAVQTARRLIRALRELTAKFQDGHNALESRFLQFWVHVDWNTASIILDGYGAVLVHGNGNFRRESGERFVERVVDDFVDQVMQSLGGDVADVHGGARTNVLEVA